MGERERERERRGKAQQQTKVPLPTTIHAGIHTDARTRSDHLQGQKIQLKLRRFDRRVKGVLHHPSTGLIAGGRRLLFFVQFQNASLDGSLDANTAVGDGPTKGFAFHLANLPLLLPTVVLLLTGVGFLGKER